MSSKLTVTIGSRQYQLDLSSLTFETLKQQIVELSKEDKQGSILVKITDADGCDIGTDESLQIAVTSGQLCFNAYFEPNAYVLSDINFSQKSDSDMKDDQLRIQSEALSFKEHCNQSWRKANAEASKIVQQMIDRNEQGLVIVATNTSNWQKKADPNSIKTSSNLSSFIELVNNNNNKTNTKRFAEYYMYLIKSELIILEEITIDGNVYAINCEMQCKGNVIITSQLFVTKDSVIDRQSKQTIVSIQWNTKINHDITVQLQDLEYKKVEFTEQRRWNDSIVYSQKHLQLSTSTFGFDHPYVAISYNLISNGYYNKRNYQKSIELLTKSLNIGSNALGVNCRFVAMLNYNFGNTYTQQGLCDIAIGYYQKALEIQSNIPGIYYDDISGSYNNLGNVYHKKQDWDKAIKCLQQALSIRREHTVEKVSKDIGDCCCNLGFVLRQKGEKHTASKYYQEAWHIFNIILGEWNSETIRVKMKIKQLSE
ncbi:hypothetical protein RFI_14926 [Reticulomyxa filosa]|uniref:Uncharacterized protein n=1 Tax=Reticulomyxa filosa TaxID=46433 RepID=X6N937_RETFI|nr:hypothetical protein RFI_14926 [Reticulomyxa filosa]|eukprot:ETO22274.1 hypothetical protein RFI_14926 [Reticulomyxa filosa]